MNREWCWVGRVAKGAFSSRPHNEPISASVYFRDDELYGTEADKKVEWLGGSLGGPDRSDVIYVRAYGPFPRKHT